MRGHTGDSGKGGREGPAGRKSWAWRRGRQVEACVFQPVSGVHPAGLARFIFPVSREMSRRTDHGALPGGSQLPEFYLIGGPFSPPLPPSPTPQLLPTGPVLRSRESSTCLTHPLLPTKGTLVRPPVPTSKVFQAPRCHLRLPPPPTPHPLPVLSVAALLPHLC